MLSLRHAIAFLAFAYAGIGVAADFNARQAERAIEAEIGHVLSDRIAPKLYLVSVRVTENPVVVDKTGKKLPFAPLEIDQLLVDRSLRRADDANLAFETFSFSVVLTFDASLKDDTVGRYEEVVRQRLQIDNGKRTLAVKRAQLFDASSEPGTQKAAAEALAAAERQQAAIVRERAESERSRAQLETERARLELTKKELESARERKQYEEKLQQSKETLNKEIATLNSKIQKAQAKVPVVAEPKPSALSIFQSVQPTIIGALLLFGLVAAFLFAGGSLRRGLTSMADGIKAIGEAIGEGFRSQEKGKAQEKAATEEKGAEPSAMATPHWTHGVPTYDAFLELVKDKLDVLSRSKNFGFMRTFVDMIENDATAPLAAAALVALPDSAASLLVAEISPGHVARIRSVIEAPGGLARAKAMRGVALQDFYGRIAVDEFSNSPLAKLNNMSWLTRLNTQEIANLALEMDARFRSAFLACLSPVRVRKILETTTDAGQKEKLIAGLAGMAAVDSAKLQEFTQYAATLAPAQNSPGNLGKIDTASFVGEFVADLNPEDQQALLKSFASDPAITARLREQFVPFDAIIYAEADLVASLFSGLSDSETAKALYVSGQPVREHVISALSRIRAEVVRSELQLMDQQPQSSDLQRRDSLNFQKTVAKQLLKLVRSGLVKIPANANFKGPGSPVSANKTLGGAA